MNAEIKPERFRLGITEEDLSTMLYGNLNEHYAKTVVDEIEQDYGSMNRHYHVWQHVLDMLEFANLHNDKVINQRVFNWSILFHDSIYDTQAKYGENEIKSAQLSRDYLTDLLPEKEIEEICRNILATASHECEPNDKQLALFLDTDLAILGREPEIYRTYSINIEREYSWMAPEKYKSGRSKILARFINNKPLYKTPEICTKLQTQAMVNMTNELAELGQII